MKRSRTLLVALFVLPMLILIGSAVAAVFPGGGTNGLKAATARFQDVGTAIDAGWSIRLADKAGIECIAQPGEGAMGVHMVNGSLLDATIDLAKPEALVYERGPAGSLKLAALEYVVFQSDWKGAFPPSLMGREFDVVPEGNRYGLPAFYALHIWVWKPNPSGLTHAWNPQVDCGPGAGT
jgi:hypothetical protein